MTKSRQTPDKEPYRAPELQEWGSVADLTATGRTNPGDDAKNGSVLSQGQ